MTNKRNKRIKRETYHSEEQTEIMHFVWILVIIILLVIGIYFFTRVFVTKDLFNSKEDTKTITPGTINYSNAIIGTMLNKSEEEYYVLLVDNSLPNAVYYTGLANNYSRNENALKIYYVDLSNELNKKYIGANNITDNLDNFKVNTNTLIKVKKGKITNYYTNEKDLETVLKYVEESTDAEN